MFRESASAALVTTGSTEITMQGGVCLVRDERSSCQETHASLLGRERRGGVLAQKALDRKQRRKIDLRFLPLI